MINKNNTISEAISGPLYIDSFMKRDEIYRIDLFVYSSWITAYRFLISNQLLWQLPAQSFRTSIIVPTLYVERNVLKKAQGIPPSVPKKKHILGISYLNFGIQFALNI